MTLGPLQKITCTGLLALLLHLAAVWALPRLSLVPPKPADPPDLRLQLIPIAPLTPPPQQPEAPPAAAEPEPPPPSAAPVKKAAPPVAPQPEPRVIPVAAVPVPTPMPITLPASAPPVPNAPPPLRSLPADGVAAEPAGGVETPPGFKADYLSNPPPTYPRQSRELGEEGRVVLRVLVGEDGKPREVQLQTSSGYDRLDRAAQDTVRRWQFTPARRGVQPIEGWVLVPIKFDLQAKP